MLEDEDEGADWSQADENTACLKTSRWPEEEDHNMSTAY